MPRRARFDRGRVVVGPVTPPALPHPPSHGGGHGHGHGRGGVPATLAEALAVAVTLSGSSAAQTAAARVPSHVIPTFHATIATAAQNIDSSSYVVTLPTYAAGDIVFIHLANTNSGSATDTTFSAPGWTLLDTGRVNATWDRSAILWRVMTGSEGTTVTVTFGGGAPGQNRTAGQATSYSNGSGLDGAAVVAESATYSGSLSLSKTTTGPNELAVELVAYLDPVATNFTPTQGTERYDQGPYTIGSTGWHLEGNDLAAATAGSYTLAGTFSDTSQYRAVLVAVI